MANEGPNRAVSPVQMVFRSVMFPAAQPEVAIRAHWLVCPINGTSKMTYPEQLNEREIRCLQECTGESM